MCGIAGSINAPLGIEDIQLLHHRGPDHQAVVQMSVGNDTISFGHTRLAILDLSEAGNQPMFSECGNYCIVFNGEIYNHQELRKKLKDVHFKGHSDTETIIYYLRQYGIEAVNDFNGIFSFAFLDKIKGKLFLVRDHFGVKPLYYYLKGNSIIFGSELKVILNNRIYRKEINFDAVNTLLSFRYNPAPDTAFKSILKLKASHFIEYDLVSKAAVERKYWQKKQAIDRNITEEDAIQQYKYLLTRAVKRQLLSDVPVGLLLSGGLDSAVLGILMRNQSDKAIKTFTLGFEGKGDYNELAFAKESAAIIDSQHYEASMTKDLYFEYLNKSFYHIEEPIAEPTIPALMLLSELASTQVKVVLSGQGIDEPMAGYKKYKGEQIISKYKALMPFIPFGFLRKLFPRNHSLARGALASKYNDDLERFIGIGTIYSNDLKNQLYKDAYKPYSRSSQKHLFESYVAAADESSSSVSKLLYADTRTMLPDNLLLFNDKATMASSIENRVPYLDIELINFIESLPIHFKLNGNVTKYLHREAVKDMVPSSIIKRKKRGFATPIDQWFQGDLANTLVDIVKDGDSFSRIYFDTKAICKMIDLHQAKKANYKNELFMILSIELWFKHFYSKN